MTIVDEVKKGIPSIKAGLPSALTLTPIFDQSVLMRASTSCSMTQKYLIQGAANHKSAKQAQLA